ncbi:MAG: hypothetical protein HeimC2_20340 [Candidatus Heimdallarchaeota archaeon LC_2]|nr:MAG: hypothetical protein HeimC2_20340 [Candidatus Heimdallarchaeota archaeon LC_2]
MDNTELGIALNGWLATNYPDIKLNSGIYEASQHTTRNIIAKDYLYYLKKQGILPKKERNYDSEKLEKDTSDIIITLNPAAKKIIPLTDTYVHELYNTNQITNFKSDIIVLHDYAIDKQLSTIFWCLLISIINRRLIIALTNDLTDFNPGTNSSLAHLIYIGFSNHAIKARARSEINRFEDIRDKILHGIQKPITINPIILYFMISMLQVIEFYD